jgi:hypothetical protein
MTDRSGLIEGLVLSGMAGLPVTLLTDGSLSHTAPKKYGKLERLPAPTMARSLKMDLHAVKSCDVRMNLKRGLNGH